MGKEIDSNRRNNCNFTWVTPSNHSHFSHRVHIAKCDFWFVNYRWLFLPLRRVRVCVCSYFCGDNDPTAQKKTINKSPNRCSQTASSISVGQALYTFSYPKWIFVFFNEDYFLCDQIVAAMTAQLGTQTHEMLRRLTKPQQQQQNPKQRMLNFSTEDCEARNIELCSLSFTSKHCPRWRHHHRTTTIQLNASERMGALSLCATKRR